MSTDRVLAAVRKAADDPRTGEVLWRVRADDGSVDATFGDPTRPFFLASATKLYTVAILCQLRAEGRVDWDAPVAPLVPLLDLSGLSVASGRDRSAEMTVREVMAHTAGLADYFEGPRPDGPSTFERLLAEDAAWTPADAIAWTRPMKPGTPGVGLYSDSGFQILGALIEAVDQSSFADSVRRRITEPLGLSGTYVFGATDIARYGEVATMLHGESALRIPLAMSSVQADGGIVSTLDDGLMFLIAFFDGRLFPAPLLDELMTDWHPVFFPLEYGTGIMRFRVRWYFSPLRRIPPFVGHSGASGVVMFRCPDLGMTVVGTVNQVSRRSLPYQLMVRSALAAGRSDRR